MNKLLKAMFCVTFFSVSTRALGFLLKIYLSRKLSSELLGSYQVAMSIFAVFMTLVSSGIPVVLSRNTSFYHGKNNQRGIGSLVSSGLILTGIISLIVCLVVIFCPSLMEILFTSKESADMILILLPALVFSSIYEVLRGALWGKQHFFDISFTEFLEQITRIIILVILFETAIFDMSLTNKTALSLSIACIISSIHVAIIYFKKGGTFANPKYEFKNLLKTSSPITAVRTISSIVSSIIAVIVPIRLMTFGYTSSEALSIFGIIMGMTFPLIMIPSTLISSLAVTIIPSISEQSNDIDNGELKNTSILKSKINFSLKTTVLFSTILLPLYLSAGIPICKFIFNNEQAGKYLIFAAVLMIPMGISQITSSILNAIGLEMKSLKNYAVASTLLIICIYFLPKYIGGFAIIVGYLCMSICSSTMNIIMLKNRKLISFEFLKTAIKMISISVFAAAIGYFTYNILSNIELIALFISSAVTMISMISLVYVFNIANIKMIFFKPKTSSTK